MSPGSSPILLLLVVPFALAPIVPSLALRKRRLKHQHDCLILLSPCMVLGRQGLLICLYAQRVLGWVLLRRHYVCAPSLRFQYIPFNCQSQEEMLGYFTYSDETCRIPK